MKVTHRLVVTATCPTTGLRDVYDVAVTTVRPAGLLLVEDILEAADALTAKPIFQEELTRCLARDLDAQVTTVGRHLNIVETTVEAG